MTDDPSESNKTCSEDFNLEESMSHILFFEIAHKTKGIFLVWNLGGFFIDFQLRLIELTRSAFLS